MEERPDSSGPITGKLPTPGSQEMAFERPPSEPAASLQDYKLEWPAGGLHQLMELERVTENVSAMLSRLTALNVSEKALLRTRLIPIVRQAQERVSDLPPALFLGGLAAHVLAPWMLLRWSLADHGLILTIFIYLSSTVLSLISDLILILASLFMLRSEHVLWAWDETHDADAVREEQNDRRRSLVRGGVALLLLLPIVAVGMSFLRGSDQSFIVELLCISPLVSIAAALFTSLTGIAIRLTRPYWSRKATRFLPADVLLLEFVNLAFFTQESRDQYGSVVIRDRLLLAIETASDMAEYLFPGRHRSALRGDHVTQNWCRVQSSNIAAALRKHKESVLYASSAKDFDRIAESLCSGLVAAAQGDWQALTLIPGAPATKSRIKSVARYLLPSAVLIAAAFLLPRVPGLSMTPEVTDSLRLSLLIPAALVLLTPLTPEAAKVTETISKALENSGRGAAKRTSPTSVTGSELGSMAV